jgi:hypothetical protein
VIVKPQALEVCLIPTCEASAQTEDPSLQDPAPRRPLTTTITLPWTAPIFAAVKGIINAPCTEAAITDGTAPGDLTVTDLAKALPYSWAAQEETIGLSS